jgi:hypothetical protein
MVNSEQPIPAWLHSHDLTLAHVYTFLLVYHILHVPSSKILICEFNLLTGHDVYVSIHIMIFQWVWQTSALSLLFSCSYLLGMMRYN